MKEIVIKISDNTYKVIKDDIYCGILDPIVYDAIKNGTELPKGHGDLRDTATIVDKLADTDIYLTDADWKKLGEAIGSAKVLVEANKGDKK